MEKNSYEHIPVLLGEAIRYLDPQPGESYVDATLGGGGYTRAILEKNQPGGKVLAIDLDQDAIENFKNPKPKTKNTQSAVTLVHGNFRDIDKIVTNHRFENISGIVADIGLSSYQLDQSERGISFQKHELLDMRFDRQGQQEDAKFMVNSYDVGRLEKIFREFGEERFSHQIAKRIVGTRNKNSIKYTNELFDIIEDALPKPVKHKVADSARRVFQALRVSVNHELENLQEFLPKAFDLLVPGGRLVVVSFHSLEDRIVKQFFADLAKGCVCPPDFPQCVCGRNPQAKLLTRKPVKAGTGEQERNSRSKSALLRAVIKL